MVIKDIELAISEEKLHEVLNKEIKRATNEYEKIFAHLGYGAVILLIFANVMVIKFNNLDVLLAGVMLYLLYITANWNKIKVDEWWHVKCVDEDKPERFVDVLDTHYEIFHLNELSNNKLFRLISLTEKFKKKTISIHNDTIVFRDNVHAVDYNFKVDYFVTGKEVTDCKLLLTEKGLVAQVPNGYIVSERETYSFEGDKTLKYNSVRKVKESLKKFSEDSALSYCDIVSEDILKEG